MTKTRSSRAFSLAELLLAIFILGIGIIAVAALFPAGIAQQRQSADDLVGPVVANNALALLRSRLRPEYFGYVSPSFTLDGDFGWRRPAFYRRNTTENGFSGPVTISAGSLNVFDGSSSDTSDTEVPWNTALFAGPPRVIITQAERYYPMATQLVPPLELPRPQYVWDCMFRRFNGKVLVAIFVYRASIVGGGAVAFSVPPNGDVPPFPIWLDLTQNGGLPWWDGSPWDAGINDATIPGTEWDTPFDPTQHNEQWQAPGQWILDQNNTIHRVLVGRRRPADGPVELLRPIPQMPGLPAYFFPTTVDDVDPVDGLWDKDVLTDLFYVPSEVQLDIDRDGTVDGVGATLTPVYVTVREL
ncbi:MAG: hypothetical protein ACYS0D_11215 [Planctomycetota bacterium]